MPKCPCIIVPFFETNNSDKFYKLIEKTIVKRQKRLEERRNGKSSSWKKTTCKMTAEG